MSTWARSERRSAIAIAVATSLGVLMVSGALESARGASDKNGSELARARRASARFHREAVAIDAGHQRGEFCEELEGVGGMGFHYTNPALLDGTAVVTQPEAILYEEGKNGKRRLIGVEYIVVDEDQDLTTDDDRPSLFGVEFDGPMPGHFPGMPIHYDLHVWLWKKNPAGMFAVWNPRVDCS